MKRLILLAMAALMVVPLASCGAREVPDTYCDTLADAEKLIGFKLAAPESVGESRTRTYFAGGRTLEIMYFSGKVMDARISKCDDGSNVSGNRFGCENEREVEASGVKYTLCGSESGGKVSLAVWTKGKYSYLVLVGAPRTEEELLELCKTVK